MPKINVSEIAAVIGQHIYQSPKQAMLKVWRREDPVSYIDSLQRNGIRVYDAYCLPKPILYYLRTIDDPYILKCSGDSVVNDVIDRLLMSQQKIVAFSAMKPFSNHQSPKEFKQAIIESCKGFINCNRGIRSEASIIENFESVIGKKVVRRNYPLYTDKLGDHLWIKGRVDGVVMKDENVDEKDGIPDAIVEVKKRQRNITFTIDIHDLVQVHTYMHLLDIDNCYFVEDFDGTCKYQIIKRDKRFFEESIKKPLLEWYQEWHSLISSSEEQDKFLDLESL